MESKHKYLLGCKDAQGNFIGWMWWCPACEEFHGGATEGRWSFNGNHDAPTFTPSFLVRAALDPETGKPAMRVCETVEGRCHTFVRAGKIEYLGDCTHKLAGQTVEMVPLEQLE